MKNVLLMFTVCVMAYACSGEADGNNGTNLSDNGNKKNANISDYDPHRGEGKFSDVEIGALNPLMADTGKKIFDVKCSACHKLTTEKLVGPGWSGVTQKHSAAWIMNFITNPDAMINKDPELQSQLEICLVRMPNQNLTDDDARSILAFMLKNDGNK